MKNRNIATLAIALAALATSASAQERGYVRPDVAELSAATKQGDFKSIERLLAAGVPVDGVNALGQQPLIVATKAGHHRVALLLLKHGADPNTRTRTNAGCSALTFASVGGDLRLVEALIEAGATTNLRCRNGLTALGAAAQAGHADIVAYLLKHGADPNAWGWRDHNSRQWTAVCSAACNSQQRILEMLLKIGGDPKTKLSNGDPLITVAARTATKPVLEMLLEGGADLEAPMRGGATPIAVALQHGNLGAARLFLARGAKINGQLLSENGRPKTALELAKISGERPIVQLVESALASAE